MLPIPLLGMALLALAFGIAIVCKRQVVRFAGWNFLLLMLCVWLTEILIVAFGLAFFVAFRA